MRGNGTRCFPTRFQSGRSVRLDSELRGAAPLSSMAAQGAVHVGFGLESELNQPIVPA